MKNLFFAVFNYVLGPKPSFCCYQILVKSYCPSQTITWYNLFQNCFSNFKRRRLRYVLTCLPLRAFSLSFLLHLWACRMRASCCWTSLVLASICAMPVRRFEGSLIGKIWSDSMAWMWEAPSVKKVTEIWLSEFHKNTLALVCQKVHVVHQFNDNCKRIGMYVCSCFTRIS